MNFNDFGLEEKMIEAIDFMGFKEATPVQELAIPKIMTGKDLIASAQTGTGKTAAFVLPIINNLVKHHTSETKALILAPTRELALQIDQQIQGFSYFTPVDSIAIYGGGSGSNWDNEKKALSSGANIIVATPGRLISHLNMGYVKFNTIEYLILDEADRMLDIGFYDDIIKIIKHIPKKRQTLMFSATMPDKIKKLTKEILTNPDEISLAVSKPAEGVLQAAYLTYDNQKTSLISELLKDKPDVHSVIIFSSTKQKVNDIVRGLRKTEKNVHGISSSLEQSKREQVLADFKARKIRILVATDVLSRGIDIKDIDIIINYDVPHDAEDYVHRVGRTARAKSEGLALTLINEDDMYKFSKIEKFIEDEVMKIPLPTYLGKGPEWKVVEKYPKKRNFGKKHRFKNNKK